MFYRMAPPRVGQPAPALDLVMPKDASGRPGRFVLADAVKKGPVIVAFIPGAYTSTCHEEMCNFRDSWGEFAKLDAQFIAVSPDGPHVQKAWATDIGVTLPFGSDLDKENIRRWGVEWRAWWGTVAKRATFVVDKNGIVRFAEVLPDADLLPTYQRIREALTGLAPNLNQ